MLFQLIAIALVLTSEPPSVSELARWSDHDACEHPVVTIPEAELPAALAPFRGSLPFEGRTGFVRYPASADALATKDDVCPWAMSGTTCGNHGYAWVDVGGERLLAVFHVASAVTTSTSIWRLGETPRLVFGSLGRLTCLDDGIATFDDGIHLARAHWDAHKRRFVGEQRVTTDGTGALIELGSRPIPPARPERVHARWGWGWRLRTDGARALVARRDDERRPGSRGFTAAWRLDWVEARSLGSQ